MTGQVPALELLGVSRKYGTGPTAVTALDTVSLQVLPGELVSIMGASGSGKSTLLSIAGGLDQPDAGDVMVSGSSILNLRPKQLARLRRSRLGFVFQNYNLVPSLTALENIALPLELDGVAAVQACAAADEGLAAVGLSGLGGRYPDTLSGGQQQRVAIARSLIGSRSIILADEPTGALDSATGEDVLGLLRERIDAGAAGILVTHDARHAAWADRIIFMSDGRISDQTNPRAFPDPAEFHV